MRRAAASVASLVLVLVLAADARADDASQAPARAAWHPKYATELEAHADFAIGDDYGAGVGAGARLTLPVWENAPIRRIDDTIGLAIGLDWIHYGSYRPHEPGGPTATADVMYVPLALPIDVWLGKVAVFVEPTVVWRFARYDGTCSVTPCAETSRFFPTGAIGMRIKTHDRVAITIRLGWPMFTLGASWL